MKFNAAGGQIIRSHRSANLELCLAVPASLRSTLTFQVTTQGTFVLLRLRRLLNAFAFWCHLQIHFIIILLALLLLVLPLVAW